MTMTETLDKDLAELIRKNTAPLLPFPTDTEPKLEKLSGIKALLFDVYGTMLISGTGDIGIAQEKQNDFPIAHILSEMGLKILVDKESVDVKFADEINGLIRAEHIRLKKEQILFPEVDIREIWKELILKLNEDNYIEGELTEDEILKASLTYECLINPVWPMPGISKLLDHLYTREELHLGIVSNAQFYTEPILRNLLGFQCDSGGFNRELLFYSYQEKEAKPSVNFFNKAVLKLKNMYNISPGEILYIGNDMLNDVFTAGQCGCRTALFAGDRRSLRLRHSDERCKNLQPDIVLTHMDQLVGIL